MKRIGHLFEQAFTLDALYQAWADASRGKRDMLAAADKATKADPVLVAHEAREGKS